MQDLKGEASNRMLQMASVLSHKSFELLRRDSLLHNVLLNLVASFYNFPVKNKGGYLLQWCAPKHANREKTRIFHGNYEIICKAL